MFTKLFGKRSAKTASKTLAATTRTRLGLHSLEAREVPAVLIHTNMLSNGTQELVIEGDNSNNEVLVNSDGTGNIVVTSPDLPFQLGGAPQTYGSAFGTAPVSRIVIDAKGGSDDIEFRQGSSTSHRNLSRSLDLRVNLGDGNDSFIASIFGDIGTNDISARSLDIDVSGGSGGDAIFVFANNDVDIRKNSRLGLNIRGDNDFDLIQVNYRGDLDGTLGLDVSGGNGDDSLYARVDLDNGSTGFIKGYRDDTATLAGDWDSDRVEFLIFKANTSDEAKVSAEIDGGWSPFDNDRGYRTGNVEGRNFENTSNGTGVVR